MKIDDFYYQLPKELIAQKPSSKRDHSRLMVINRSKKTIKDHTFYEILDFIKKGDILVLNDSKVFPARLFGIKKTGGQTEILLTKRINQRTFEIIGKKLKERETILFSGSKLIAEVIFHQGKISHLRFSQSGEQLISEIFKIGKTPLPPYIKNKLSEADNRSRYQTVYAKNSGSIAAPTAGLHFTDELLSEIKKTGVEILSLTLHVGLGTFAPIEKEIEDHQMHAEYYQIEKDVYKKIIKAKKAGQRIIAVGTTTTRVLETLALSQIVTDKKSALKSDFDKKPVKQFDNLISGWTDIFIYPPYEFNIIDALITNFHLPKSTLLLLVSAFAGKELIDQAYRQAVNERYRFFSYGDAMLIV
jgi:S-adenosylmethionine:tRNA ribosyltransferase-isomerase